MWWTSPPLDARNSMVPSAWLRWAPMGLPSSKKTKCLRPSGRGDDDRRGAADLDRSRWTSRSAFAPRLSAHRVRSSIDGDRSRYIPNLLHSMINGFCKPLIRLDIASNRAGFTVRCTATSRGIPARSFHHRSISIESSRRVRDGQLSRSIDIYRLPRRAPMPSARARVGQGRAREGPASNMLIPCPDSDFRQEIYRQALAGPWMRTLSPVVAARHANSATTVASYTGASSRGATLRAMSSRVGKVFRS